MNIVKNIMPAAQYNTSKTAKTTIILHHTAGGHNPNAVVDFWESDADKIGTHYVIGGKSTRNGDTSMDGTIVQALPEDAWIYHLGVKGSNGRYDKSSIGIEICNYGGLNFKNGKFITYVASEVPPQDVVDLGFVWRGYRYWHKYTDAQLSALKWLIQDIAGRNKINVKRTWDVKSFDTDILKLTNFGLTTHVNYRKDKNDCSPQPNLINILNSL